MWGGCFQVHDKNCHFWATSFRPEDSIMRCAFPFLLHNAIRLDACKLRKHPTRRSGRHEHAIKDSLRVFRSKRPFKFTSGSFPQANFTANQAKAVDHFEQLHFRLHLSQRGDQIRVLEVMEIAKALSAQGYQTRSGVPNITPHFALVLELPPYLVLSLCRRNFITGQMARIGAARRSACSRWRPCRVVCPSPWLRIPSARPPCLRVHAEPC